MLRLRSELWKGQKFIFSLIYPTRTSFDVCLVLLVCWTTKLWIWNAPWPHYASTTVLGSQNSVLCSKSLTMTSPHILLVIVSKQLCLIWSSSCPPKDMCLVSSLKVWLLELELRSPLSPRWWQGHWQSFLNTRTNVEQMIIGQSNVCCQIHLLFFFLSKATSCSQSSGLRENPS